MRLNRLMTPLIAAIVAAAPASAQFDVSWNTIDGGGAMFTTAAGDWELSGTIGQPDAGAVMTGGGFEISGGFWAGAALPCPGDINGDGIVDLSDLAGLLSHYGVPSGASLADGDLDGDGDVDLTDLSVLLSNFGTDCSS